MHFPSEVGVVAGRSSGSTDAAESLRVLPVAPAAQPQEQDCEKGADECSSDHHHRGSEPEDQSSRSSDYGPYDDRYRHRGTHRERA
jgi:hypothetical protein